MKSCPPSAPAAWARSTRRATRLDRLVAIKVGLGRLDLKDPLALLIEQSGFDQLPLTFEHAERFQALPHHHGDPFDRMLVAQAQVEHLTLVSHDRALESYGVPVIWTWRTLA